MPGSSDDFRQDVLELVNEFPFPTDILDIGAGQGTYADLLNPLCENIEAVEVYTPYIERFDLARKYDAVHNVNIMDFDLGLFYYDIMIMGDVMEHLTRQDAIDLIQDAVFRCEQLIVIVPFETPQGAVGGNKYEIHLQPDLTPVIMESEYGKWLQPYKLNSKRGLYIKT